MMARSSSYPFQADRLGVPPVETVLGGHEMEMGVNQIRIAGVGARLISDGRRVRTLTQLEPVPWVREGPSWGVVMIMNEGSAVNAVHLLSRIQLSTSSMAGFLAGCQAGPGVDHEATGTG